MGVATPTKLFLCADIIRGWRLLEVFNYVCPKIRGADIIRVGVSLEGIWYVNLLTKVINGSFYGAKLIAILSLNFDSKKEKIIAGEKYIYHLYLQV